MGPETEPLTTCPVPGCNHDFDVDLTMGVEAMIEALPAMMERVAEHLWTHDSRHLAEAEAVISDRLKTVALESEI